MTCETQPNCARLVCSTLPIQPTCLNLSIVSGTDNQLEVTITDGDGKAIAINNDTIDFTVKEWLGGALVWTKSNGPGAHSDPGLGQTIFNIAAADTVTASTSAVTWWVFEIRRITAGGDERVHISGAFVVRPAI